MKIDENPKNDNSCNPSNYTSAFSNFSDIKNDVTGGMKLKIQTAINIIMDSDGLTPVVCCGLDQKAFHTSCVDENYEDLNDCTVIQHVNSQNNKKQI